MDIYVEKLKFIFAENIRWIIIFTLACTAMSIIYCLVAPKQYTTSVVINPPKLSDAGAGLNPAVGAQIMIGGVGVQRSDLEIATRIMQTREINKLINAEIKNSGVFGGISFNSGYGLNLVPDYKSGFLEIYVKSTDPKLSKFIADYVPVALGTFISDVAFNKTLQRMRFYNEQIQIANEEQRLSESNLNGFRKKYGIVAGRQDNVLSDLATQLQGQLASQQMTLDSLAARYTTSNPDYLSAKAIRDAIQSKLNQISNSIVIGDKEIKTQNGFALNSRVVAQYTKLEQEYELKSLVYTVLIRQREATKLDIGSERLPVAIDLIDSADLPTKSSDPQKLKIILATCCISFCGMLLIILYKNRKLFLRGV